MDDAAKNKIKKIANMLALANDKGATAGERDNAQRLAQRMMADLNISQAEVLEQHKKNGPKADKCRFTIGECKQFGPMHAINHTVAGAIAIFCDVKYFYVKGEHHFSFFGLPEDACLAQYLFESLQDQLFPAWERFKDTNDYALARMNGDHAITIQSSFRAGWEQEVRKKLIEMWQEKNDLVGSERSTALVVLKKDLIVKDFADTGIKLRSGGQRYKEPKSDAGLDAGKKAGRGVSVASGGIEAPRKQIEGSE